MKATGIVRRIDDLGRIVIPKETRRILHLKEGAPMEIYTGRDGEIILKEYKLLDDIENDIEKLIISISDDIYGDFVNKEKILELLKEAKKLAEYQEEN